MKVGTELGSELKTLFAQLAQESLVHEQQGTRPLESVQRLAQAGIGALRLPKSRGGAGLSVVELTEVIAQLAEADSNIAHLLRGHFGFTELILLRPDGAEKELWLERIARGEIIGNATSEQTGNTLADIQTRVEERDGRWVLNGKKFYSTGTLYADWVYLAAGKTNPQTGAVERVTFAVSTSAPGVQVVDDWAGFGQKATASGTTIFEDVEVDPATFSTYRDAPQSHIQAFYQLYLLAVQTGIGRALVRDVRDYVRERTRTYIHANAALPKEDPQVLEVVGKIAAASFSADASVERAARQQDLAIATNVPGAGIDLDAMDRAEHATYLAQLVVHPAVLQAASDFYEVGGASAVFAERGFDRHWRNARVVASHNPTIYKAKLAGDYVVNDAGPTREWRKYDTVGPSTF